MTESKTTFFSKFKKVLKTIWEAIKKLLTAIGIAKRVSDSLGITAIVTKTIKENVNEMQYGDIQKLFKQLGLLYVNFTDHKKQTLIDAIVTLDGEAIEQAIQELEDKKV